MVKEFYEEKTSNLKMSYQSYDQYYLSKFSYNVSKPKTGVCDFGEEYSNKLKLYPNGSCKVSFTLHLRKNKRKRSFEMALSTSVKK